MPIYFTESSDRKEFVQKIIEKFDDDLMDRNSILLKPNIVSPDPYPATTHPELLEELIIQLKGLGKNVYVADGPGFDRGKGMLKTMDIHHVCSRQNVQLFNFKSLDKTIHHINSGQNKYMVYEMPFEYDYLISLPVLKAHKLDDVMMTCALKNQFAFIANLNRLKLHLFNHIHTAITDINTIIKPDLYIIDAQEVLMHANEVRYGGKAKKCGVMYCGTDPVALDSYGFSLLKQAGESKVSDKAASDVRYLMLAENQDLGSLHYLLERI